MALKNPLFMQVASHLRVRVNHAVCIHDFEWTGSNSLPVNRLFFLFGDSGGYIRHTSGGSVRELELKPDHIYFMPRHAQLDFRFESGTGIVAFHYSMEVFRHFYLLEGQESCKAVADSDGDIGLVRSLMESTTSPYDILMLESMLFKYTCIFMDKRGGNLPVWIGLSEKYRGVFEQIERTPDARLKVGDLARQANLSRDTFSKNFRRDFGLPLKTFLQRQMIDQAAELLLYTDMRIGEIARKLNFNDEFYFSRFFRKHMGESPRSYREKNRPREISVTNAAPGI